MEKLRYLFQPLMIGPMEVKNRMVGQEVDRPRLDALARLRAQLKEEDEMTGGRATARRGELEQRILSLHGTGR